MNCGDNLQAHERIEKKSLDQSAVRKLPLRSG